MNKFIVSGRHFALLICTFLQISHTSYSQNTLAYTDPESHYNKGIELFQKKVYTASREEFKHYIQLTEKTLKENEFNLTNAEYYSALSGLYAKAVDADIEIERFVVNHSDHPKAKVIYNDLGKYFYDQGDYNKAIVYLEKATTDANDRDIQLTCLFNQCQFNLIPIVRTTICKAFLIRLLVVDAGRNVSPSM
jgi:tetratricopeptide (TPR) repeat protein